jgi:hypothetical protein
MLKKTVALYTFKSLLAAGEDYTISNADLMITLPAGEPVEQCIPVGIVDDRVALEGEETFQFFFESVPEGVDTRFPNEAFVTIVDNDEGINLKSVLFWHESVS